MVEELAELQPPVAPKVLPPVIPPTRRSSIETIPLGLPAQQSSNFEVDALRPLAAIEDQGRRMSSVVAMTTKPIKERPYMRATASGRASGRNASN